MTVEEIFKCKALDDYLGGVALTSCNAISALSMAFIECFLECRESGCGIVDLESFVSYFNRVVSERLSRAYSCDRVKGLLKESRRHIEEIYWSIGKVFGSALMLCGKLKSRLSIHTRSPILPLDISLAWDPILDLPYIPASSIKGVVRSYFKNKEIKIDNLGVDNLLGEGEEKGHVGYVIFLDAYPVDCESTLLEPDVITPHYKEAMDETSVRPTPIVFPTIAPGTKICFPIAINTKQNKRLGNMSIVNKLIKSIAEALEEGIGAKTSLGYGRIKIEKEQAHKSTTSRQNP